jgi:hypothetical protein
MTSEKSLIDRENLITVSINFIDKIISRGGSPWWDDKEFYDGAPDGLWSEEKRYEFSWGLKSLCSSVYNKTYLEVEVLTKRIDMIMGKFKHIY